MERRPLLHAADSAVGDGIAETRSAVTDMTRGVNKLECIEAA